MSDTVEVAMKQAPAEMEKNLTVEEKKPAGEGSVSQIPNQSRRLEQVQSFSSPICSEEQIRKGYLALATRYVFLIPTSPTK
jgi:hypothetical protein